jgi:uncharacterized protein (DUF305 family)
VRKRFDLPTACALTALLAACAGHSTQSSSVPAPLPGDSAAQLEARYRVHADSAIRNFTAADVAFMTGMISHHGQALVMAAMIPSRTTSSAMRTLGGRITNAQRDEIALMQQWLRQRNQPVPTPDSAGGMAMMPGMDHGMMMNHAMMPGMLTPQQLQDLRAATGTAFDRLFLVDMIQHHTGAVTMVDSLFNANGAAQDETVFKLASGVRVDQTTEIERMRLMLQALP